MVPGYDIIGSLKTKFDYFTVPIHVHLQHQVEKLIFSWVLSHRSHDSQQLLWRNRSAPVLEYFWLIAIPATASLSGRVPLTLSNASNASFSSAFSKFAKSEDIISPSYLSASPDKVKVERNSEVSSLKQNYSILAKLEKILSFSLEPELTTFTDYSSVPDLIMIFSSKNSLKKYYSKL